MVIEHHASKLPLLLDKWDYFRTIEQSTSLNMERLAKERMQQYLSYPLYFSLFSFLMKTYRRGSKHERILGTQMLMESGKFEQLLKEDIVRYVHLPWIFAITAKYFAPEIGISQRWLPDILDFYEMPRELEKPQINLQPSVIEESNKIKKILDVDDYKGWMGRMMLDNQLLDYLIKELKRLEKFGNSCAETAKYYLKRIADDDWPYFDFYIDGIGKK
jgi:hypothetical protein